MKVKNFGYLSVVAMFLVSGALSWNLYFKVYRQKDTVDIAHFPRAFDGWESEEIAISDNDLEILETRNAFVRRYFDKSGQEVYVFIVYSQNNRKVSHPPEICYTGGGAVILQNARDTVLSADGHQEIQANRLIVEKGKTRQVSFYWFKVGDSFTSNYWKQQGLIALKSFLGQSASSALIRLSADVHGGDDAQTVQQIKNFAQSVIPYLSQYLP
ncbi:MAG: exosortase C-terminal domain/associated protein EpsI [Candidatus Omnitrophota bacterium]